MRVLRPYVRLSGSTDSARANDLLHPNQAGHLHIAGVLFKLMNADGLVSAVELDARSGKVVKTSKTVVRTLVFQNGVLTFQRLDESLPLPIDDLARPALSVDAQTGVGTPHDLFGLSCYLLKVSNLSKGEYSVAIDKTEVARFSSDELAKGVDLGLMDKGPIYDQTQKLLTAVKQSVVMAVPAKGQPMVSTDVQPKVLEAAQPVEHLWTIAPVK